MITSKVIPFLLFVVFFIQCNTSKPENILLSPEDWRSERISFPLKFAPSLKYTGQEYVRFAPGWAKPEAPDYFSYAFLWSINEDPKVSSDTLEKEMEAYFDGLMKKKDVMSKAFFEEINATTYIGKIITHDSFTTNEKISLNIMVNYSYCNQTKKHLVLFNISPQKPEHQIWKKLKSLQIDMNCE